MDSLDRPMSLVCCSYEKNLRLWQTPIALKGTSHVQIMKRAVPDLLDSGSPLESQPGRLRHSSEARS